MKESSPIASLFPKVVFGLDNTIIYDESSAGEFDKQEYEYAEQYRLYNQVTYTLLLQTYLNNCVIDDDLKNLIKEIVEKNLFVSNDRVDKVFEDIINILKGNIRLGLFDLITQFENGCRYYLKEYKGIYPVIRHGSKYDSLNLNDMLVKKAKQNKFRKAICEILDRDLTLELEYLLCRYLSGNIRNKYVHSGCGTFKKFTIDEAVVSFLLIKAYCLGYDSEINKKTAK